MEKNLFFVGLITYPKTVYPTEATQLRLEKLGLNNKTYDFDQTNEGDVNFLCCISYFISFFKIRLDWAKYLKVKFNYVKEILDLFKSLVRFFAYSSARKAIRIAIARCRNISFNHVTAWGDGYDNKINFLIVLEDDADTKNLPRDFDKILNILERIPISVRESVILDLSESYTLKELGIEHLVDYSYKDSDFLNDVFFLKRPSTNTLCAVLYGSAVLQSLVAYTNGRGRKYINFGIPIDWVLNAWMTQNFKKRTLFKAIHVKPGFFPQLSLK